MYQNHPNYQSLIKPTYKSLSLHPKTNTTTMENMNYAEELVREFLFFRGFTSTLQSFDKELSTDIGRSFHKDQIFDLIFSLYIPKFHSQSLISLFTFFKQCFSSSETLMITTLSKLEISVLRYYIVYAIQSGRNDKVIEFFKVHGGDLLQRDQDWVSWFGGYCVIYLILIVGV